MITAPLQSFLLMVIRLASDIAMLILLVRYVAAPFLYAESGPFLQAINQAAMKMSQPFRKAAWWIGFRREDISPLIAIAAILIVRGVFYTLVPLSFGQGTSTARAWIIGQQASFSMGALGLLHLMTLVLFFSVMFAHAGGFYGGVLFRIVDDIAAGVFGHMRRVIHLKNLWGLLAAGLIYLCLIYALAMGLLFWDIHLPFFWAFAFLEALKWIVWSTILLALIFIAISWLSLFSAPDDSNRAWLFLRAMVLPLLERTRQLVPWMRVGMLDLSPLLLFLGLWLAVALIGTLQALLFQAYSTNHLFGM